MSLPLGVVSKRIRVTADHRRDFEAYLRWRQSSDRTFLPWEAPLRERGSDDTVETWVEIESRGATARKPADPLALKAAEEGKRLLNFQIRQWAEGSVDPCVTIPAELREAYP